MTNKEDIKLISFWDAVEDIAEHFHTPHRSVYIFSADKLLYTVAVNKLYKEGKVDNFTLEGTYGNPPKKFHVQGQESCRTFIRNSRYGSIQVMPIDCELPSSKMVTGVYLYDIENWTEEQWRDFQWCKMKKFKNNMMTSITAVSKNED